MEDIQKILIEQQINRISAISEQSLTNLSSSYKLPNLSESSISHVETINFSDKLHLQILIKSTLEKFINCTIGLEELVFICQQNKKEKKETQHGLFIQISEKEEAAEKEVIGQDAIQHQKQIYLMKLLSSLQIFKKMLLLREVQLTMILFIEEYREREDFEPLFLNNYISISKYAICKEKCRSPMNLFILEDLFKREFEYLQKYQQELQLIKNNFDQYLIDDTYNETYNEELLQQINQIKIINSKIVTIAEIFPYACTTDLDDLFACNQVHHRWQELHKHSYIRYINYGDQIKVQKSFDFIRNNLSIVNAAMSLLEEQKDLSILEKDDRQKIYANSLKIIKIALFKKVANHEAAVMISEPNKELAKKIWNLPQQQKFRQFIELSLPEIEYSEVFYIPRKFKKYFDQRYELKEEPEYPNSLITHATSYGNQLFIKKDYAEKLKIRVNAKHWIKRKYYTITKQEQKYHLNSQVPDDGGITKQITSMISNVTKLFKKEKQIPEKLIFHIHGGGFISMSSFIHQTYTRKWAKHLDVPIVSVDYGKAPERPFPYGLYDCLEAYLWSIESFKQIYEINPKRIVLVGDSAGGNLVAALTTLLIQWNLPVPDGIVLVYPALNLNIDNYTPSLLTALNDMILPHTFLKICVQSYLKDHSSNPKENQYISPILTCNKTLKQYPPTKIFVGNKDPFHDDCCRFVEKLNDAKPGNAELTIFDQFPHGFLQFDLKLMRHEESKLATKEVENALKELLG